MSFKKVYQFLQSKAGIIIIIALYFILPFPLTTSSDAIANTIGTLIGQLISPLVIILLLSRYYSWNKSQKILHIFLIAILFEVMLTQKSLVPVINIVSILALVILIGQTIIGLFKGKPVVKKGE